MKRVFLLVLLVLASCGPQQQLIPSTDALPSIQNSVNVDSEYLQRMLVHTLQQAEQDYYESQKTPQLLYVNFYGATVKKGYDAGESSIICANEAVLPSKNLPTDTISEIDKTLNSYFKDINSNVLVVYEEPEFMTYTTVHVTDNIESTNCTTSEGADGLAALDYFNLNKQDIAFAFTNGSEDATIIANLIAHVAGHTFGLEDSNEKTDIMSPNISSIMTGFQKAKTKSKNKTQDSPALLRANVGRVNYTPLLVNSQLDEIKTLPSELEGIAGIESIAGLGKLLADVKENTIGDASDLKESLDQTLLGEENDISIEGIDELMTVLGVVSGAYMNSDSFNNLKDVLLPSLIGTIGGIPGLTEIAGYLAIATLVLDLVSILTNTKNDKVKDLPTLNGLPNLTTLLDLDKITSKAELATTASKHFAVISLNFKGNIRQSLLSFVKIAYSQRFRQIELD